jgi:hypothetical protein
MGSGPDIAIARPRRYSSSEQVNKRIRTTRGGGLQRSIGPEIWGAFREEAPHVIEFSVLSSQLSDQGSNPRYSRLNRGMIPRY